MTTGNTPNQGDEGKVRTTINDPTKTEGEAVVKTPPPHLEGIVGIRGRKPEVVGRPGKGEVIGM